MACPDCQPNSPFPSECGQVVVTQALLPGASSPVPVWIQYQCGEPPGEDQLVFYADPDLTEEIEDFNVDNIISFGAGINGTSCADSTKVDLCPDTREAIHDMFVEQTTAINENIDEAEENIIEAIEGQTSALDAALNRESGELAAILNSLRGDVATNNAATIASILSASPDFEADGVTALPAGFGSLPKTLTYNGDGRLQTISVTDSVDTWILTFTYTGANITASSGWVKQV